MIFWIPFVTCFGVYVGKNGRINQEVKTGVFIFLFVVSILFLFL